MKDRYKTLLLGTVAKAPAPGDDGEPAFYVSNTEFACRRRVLVTASQKRAIPVVVSTTSPSHTVTNSLLLASSSTHCASVVPALQLAAEGNA